MKLRSELVKIVLTCGVAALAGFMLVDRFAKGLAAPPSRVIDGFARFENASLPFGARTERELKSFVIRLKGDIDDFTRVYVNHRQVTSNENPRRPFQHIAEEHLQRFVVDRRNPIDTEVEVRRWLRKGTNWIMVELENSRWGACSMGIEFLANGTQLESSPYFIPHRERPDTGLSNAQLLTRLRDLAKKTNRLNEFGIIPEFDALCARLIVVFQIHERWYGQPVRQP